MTRTVNISDEALIEYARRRVHGWRLNQPNKRPKEIRAMDALLRAVDRLSPPPSPADEELIEDIRQAVKLVEISGVQQLKEIALKAADRLSHLSPVRLEKGKNGEE